MKFGTIYLYVYSFLVCLVLYKSRILETGDFMLLIYTAPIFLILRAIEIKVINNDTKTKVQIQNTWQ